MALGIAMYVNATMEARNAIRHLKIDVFSERQTANR